MPTYHQHEINCPLCGAEPAQHKLVQARGRKSSYIEIEGELFHDRHVMCEGCGLFFANPCMDQKSLDNFYTYLYREVYPTNHHTEITTAKLHEQSCLRLGILSGDARVLDVGSSTGIFPFLLRQHGVKTESVEPSEKHGKIAKERYGITHHQCMLEDFTGHDDAFDVVTLFDVFEHLIDPGVILDTIRGVLKPDGVFYFEIPNMRYPRHHPFVVMSAAHIYAFSATTLSYMLEKNGWRIRHLDYLGQRGNMRVLAEPCEERRTEFPLTNDHKFCFTLWDQYMSALPSIKHMDTIETEAEFREYVDGEAKRFPVVRHMVHGEACLIALKRRWGAFIHYISKVGRVSPPFHKLASPTRLLAVHGIRYMTEGYEDAAYHCMLEAEQSLPLLHEMPEAARGEGFRTIVLSAISAGFDFLIVYDGLQGVCKKMGRTEEMQRYKALHKFYYDIVSKKPATADAV